MDDAEVPPVKPQIRAGRREYQASSATVAVIPDRAARWVVADTIARHFAAKSTAFDRARFMADCGLEEEE